MKKQKIEQVRGLLSTSRPEDLPEDLADFYRDHNYKKSGPKHFAVIHNPTDEQRSTAKRLGDVIDTYTVFITRKVHEPENI